MAKKPASPFRIAPLQRVIAEPITDPAEIARIDEMRKKASREFLPLEARLDGHIKGAHARMLKLCRKLPDEQRLALLARLEAQSSCEQQLEFLAHLFTNLSPDSLRQVEKEIRRTQGR